LKNREYCHHLSYLILLANFLSVDQDVSGIPLFCVKIFIAPKSLKQPSCSGGS